jgi:hypothetical protein
MVIFAALATAGCSILVDNRLDEKSTECTEDRDCWRTAPPCSARCDTGQCVPRAAPDGLLCGMEDRNRCVAGACETVQLCMVDQECPCNEACQPLGSVRWCMLAGATAPDGDPCEDRFDHAGSCLDGRCRVMCMDDSVCRCDERCTSGGEGMGCLPGMRRLTGPCLRSDGTTGTCTGVGPECM